MPSSSSDQDSSQHLAYPPVRVDQSIERLDLNTLIMRSNAPRHTEEVPSLDESTYEVVGMSDSLYETSDDDDDEGHTASITSTPDDVSVLSDEDDDDDFEQETTATDKPPLDASMTEAPDSSIATGVDESTLTEVPFMTQSEERPKIMLQEHDEGRDGITGWAVTREYSSEQTAEGILKRYGCSEMRLTVRAALSDAHLPARNSFKILYVGNVPDWAKADMDSSIGQALNASPGPSRSIMRDGQMESYGPVISSDHCTNIKPLNDTGKPSVVMVTFDDGKQLTFGPARKYSSAESIRVPDLVVFWYPQPMLAAPEVDHFPIACEAFARQGISCLHVAEARRWHLHSGASVCTPRNLRVCVEGKKASAEFETQETHPVDIYTLQNLDSSQLNRHLAALDPRAPSTSSTETKPWNICHLFKTFAPKSVSEPSPVSIFSMITFLVSVAISVYLVSTLPVTTQQAGVEMPTAEPLSISSAPVLPPASITAASTFSFCSSSPMVTSQELTVVTPQQKDRPRPSKKEKTAGFDIETTGEYLFVLTPTKDFVSRKGKPQLQIQVSKDAESVPVRYIRTPQGTYIVELEQQYPIGQFNVSIATHSKPLMQQSFTISMGHNKTMVAQLVDLLKRDVEATREGLKKMYGSNEWKKHIQEPSQAAQELAKRQLAVGVSLLQEVSEGTWPWLRETTAPVRTSKAAHRARDNAHQIRCRVEEAMGLSSAEAMGKKSRSCKHVGR
ncbi:hypothetical protein P280DRAFT_222518 [Massarina eburnea CBS 473.64]|uniref:Uncharacterized protein n=1 Tax=Massarina eburnea CBS 473.64 TaxID=1395130 RepID=A0A6A6SAW2_9PLEO|nr:hypothetical protein P280DRAFT_222518 [Massarina eburnea CBS 473.64]